MAEFLLKYADTRGEIHQQVANAGSEKELRDRYSQQGFLIYSIKAKGALSSGLTGSFSKRKKINIEKFLIFNQQFVTLIRAGLPILKGLDLLADRLTDPKLGPYIKVRARRSPQRHAAFRRFPHAGHFPQDLRHHRAGRREKRQPGRGPRSLHHLPETVSRREEEGHGFVDVSLPS